MKARKQSDIQKRLSDVQLACTETVQAFDNLIRSIEGERHCGNHIVN